MWEGENNKKPGYTLKTVDRARLPSAKKNQTGAKHI